MIDGEAIVYTDRDVIEGRCIDLGRHGLAIRSTRATRSKTPVTLELYLQGQRLRVEAVLARRQRVHGDYVMGLRLIDLDLEARARIDRLIVERLAGSPDAELFLAFAAHTAHAPNPIDEGPADRTVVAAAGLIVPVISGHTQVVALDQLARSDRTVIAPPPPRPQTVRVDPAVLGPVSFDDSWFEDEMDTAEIHLLEATIEPEPEPEPEPERTVVAREVDVAPMPERTLVTRDAEATPKPEPTVVTRETETEEAARRPEPTWVLPSDAIEGVPEPVARTPTATMVFELGAHPVAEWPVPAADRTRTVTILHPTPPPLRGEGAPPSTLTADARASVPSILRPTQRALQQAVALLQRTDPSRGEARPRKGPRVIVSIPHRTYRRRTEPPWNQ